MTKHQKIELGPQFRDRPRDHGTKIRAASIDDEAGTVEVIWSTGAAVSRRDFMSGERFLEVLSLEPGHVRLETLQDGGPFLRDHGSWSVENVIGSIEPGTVRIEDGQALATVRMAEGDGAKEIWDKVRAGHVKGVSVGYYVHKFEVEKQDDGPDVFRAVDWEPFEVSAVVVPADRGAKFRSDMGPKETIIMRNVEMPTPKEAADAAVKDAAPQEKAPVKEERKAEPPQVDEAKVRAEARAAERERVSTITDLCRRHGVQDMEARLISDGTEIPAAREAILDAIAERADRVVTNSVHASAGGGQDEVQTRRNAAANAILHRAGRTDELLPEAREYRGLTLMEVARSVLEAGGVRTKGLSRMEVAERAFHSTSDFPYILQDAANKSLRMGYEETPRTFTPFCSRATASDFKTMHRVSLGAAPVLEALNENGEYKSTTLGEERESYALTTYGKRMSINRQSLINDDLGAFTRIPMLFGAAAARLESDTVWGVITANAAMADGNALFHANHANLGTGGGTALALASLGTARSNMAKQTGQAGETLNIRPAFIVVPSELELTAEQLLAQNLQPAQSTNVVPNSLRSLVAISEPRLSAASATAWYLMASPSQIDTIEYCYLEGEEGVYIEQATTFDVDGMVIKARLDFAAKAIDWRGMRKMNGA